MLSHAELLMPQTSHTLIQHKPKSPQISMRQTYSLQMGVSDIPRAVPWASMREPVGLWGHNGRSGTPAALGVWPNPFVGVEPLGDSAQDIRLKPLLQRFGINLVGFTNATRVSILPSKTSHPSSKPNRLLHASTGPRRTETTQGNPKPSLCTLQ